MDSHLQAGRSSEPAIVTVLYVVSRPIPRNVGEKDRWYCDLQGPGVVKLHEMTMVHIVTAGLGSACQFDRPEVLRREAT